MRDVENGLQLRSQLIKILNVPRLGKRAVLTARGRVGEKGYVSGFDSPAALLEGRFEHPGDRVSETVANFVLSRHVPCGLARDKAHPWAKRLSWQTQGRRVKYTPGLGG